MKKFALALTLGFSLALVACGQEPVESEPELRPVRTETVQLSQPELAQTLAGVARAGVESKLSFRVAGTVDQVLVALGDRVRNGQVLARLDPTDAELGLQQAQANLAQGRASLRRAEADYDRVRALYENSNASKADLDSARAGAESGRAQVDAALKQVEQARQGLSYTVLRAPSDGAIASAAIEVNENVQAGQQMFLLTFGERPEVEVGVPEVLIDQVKVGQPVELTLGALPDRVVAATVTEVAAAAAGTATFTVTVRCDDPQPEIKSGMAADVTFRFPVGDGSRIVVPLVAVGEDDSGNFVLILEDEGGGTGIVRRRDVVLGDFADGIEIREGLEAGEQIVTAGVRRIADGTRVKVLAGASG